jgi:hypothetical protein
MKTIITSLAAIAIFASCNMKTNEEKLKEMKPPVVLKSKGYDPFDDAQVILVDAKGKIQFFNSSFFDSAKVGDTIIPANVPNKNIPVNR